MKDIAALVRTLRAADSKHSQGNQPNDSEAKSNGDVDAIKDVISRYAESINLADAEIGAELFLDSDRISFINPKGHVTGWRGVKKEIYGMFADVFKQRQLQVDKQDIQVYGDSAVVVFYWAFDATFRKDGQSIRTEGRETQVLKKVDGDWRILHVHYSNMPVKGEREGF